MIKIDMKVLCLWRMGGVYVHICSMHKHKRKFIVCSAVAFSHYKRALFLFQTNIYFIYLRPVDLKP